jgi:two-component system phosphate regulon sensor histidine kinase PhoR
MAEGDKELRLPVVGTDEFGGIAGSFNRVSEELERTVRELARERDLFETVIHSMDEAVLAVDKQRRIIAVNRSATELLGISMAARGDLLLEAVRIPALSELLDHALRGESRTVDIQLESSGSVRQLMVRATPQGESGGAVLVMHDATEIRRLETVRRDFVANLTHELRTPVTAIRGYAETLESANVDPATRAEFLQTIHRNAVRIGRLVDDLLVLQELDARPHARLAVDPVEVAPLVQNVIRTAQPHAERAGVALKSSVAPGLEVLADADRLEQVVQNLVDNAIKYGGGEVRIAGEKSGGEIRLTVEDDGPGIQPDHLERVFERFYRVDAGRSREQGGSGLGLAIVKHLTESMGGSVAVDSRVGAGTRFTVRLRGAA